LRSAESGIRRSDRASDGEHLASAVKHHERCTLIRKPAQSFKGDEAVVPDHHESLQTMIYAGQADGSALIRDSIVQEQMTSVYLDPDAVAIQNEDAGFAEGVRVR
jgi:hypothetical protein